MRQSALSLSFASLFGDQSIEDICDAAGETEFLPLNEEAREMARQIVKHAPELDDRIRPFLKEWTIDRLPRLTLSILRLAFYELIFSPNIEPPVVINEAVELAKEYTTEKDAKFINGVLGQFIKELKA